MVRKDNIFAPASRHQCYSSVAPVIHQCYTSVTPALHQRYTSVTQALHQRYASDHRSRCAACERQVLANRLPVYRSCDLVAIVTRLSSFQGFLCALHRAHLSAMESSLLVLLARRPRRSWKVMAIVAVVVVALLRRWRRWTLGISPPPLWDQRAKCNCPSCAMAASLDPQWDGQRE